MIPRPLEISLMVTTDCQANCEHCCQGAWRKHNPGYHMSLVELRNFIHYTKLSGYVYDLIIISGGEPLLWQFLLSGIDILRSSRITKKLSIFTNGIELQYITPCFFNLVYNNVDSIRITNLGINSELITHMKNSLSGYSKFYFIDYSNFIKIPTMPFPNVLPADCGCPHFSFTQGKLNICTLARDLNHRFDYTGDLNKNTVGFPLCKNYLDKLILLRTFHYYMCRFCISNNKVRAQLKHVPNKSLNKEEKNV